MSFFSISRLSRLDVKWAGKHTGNFALFNVEHSNPYYEIIIVAEGPIYLQVESKKLELHSGELVILKPWEQHQAWKPTNEHANFFWVQFSCDPALRELSSLQFDNNADYLQHQDLRTSNPNEADPIILPQHCRSSRQYELLSLFEKLLETMAHPAGYFRLRCTIALWQIIEIIANQILSDKHNPLHISDSFNVYRRLVNLLDENYHITLEKQEIEVYTGRTYRYLCHIFKNYSGTTIVKYTNSLRIQRAEFLMLNTNKSIGEIAGEVGIADAFYFSKLFKKAKGLSPSEFRERYNA